MVWHAAVRLSPDERSIAIARTNGRTEILSVATQEVLAVLRGTTNEVRRIFFTPDGRQLLTASTYQSGDRGEVFAGEEVVRRWDAASGRLLQQTNLPAMLSGLALAPDGEVWAAQLINGSIEVRRTRDFALVFRQALPNVGTTAAAFSPDGRWLAVSCLANNEIRVWDMANHALTFDLRGHTEIVHDVAFSPDGRTMASASHDETIKLWRVESGQELITLPQPGGVFQVAFSQDGQVLAAGVYRTENGENLWRVRLIRAARVPDSE